MMTWRSLIVGREEGSGVAKAGRASFDKLLSACSGQAGQEGAPPTKDGSTTRAVHQPNGRGPWPHPNPPRKRGEGAKEKRCWKS